MSTIIANKEKMIEQKLATHGESLKGGLDKRKEEIQEHQSFKNLEQDNSSKGLIGLIRVPKRTFDLGS